MGKPGSFFKKLKAKQKRESAKQRRGTKGDSKEGRLRKHNERVEYFAAKREAEQLAEVSSSSEEESSTDSDLELTSKRKLRKLRRLLGVAGDNGEDVKSHEYDNRRDMRCTDDGTQRVGASSGVQTNSPQDSASDASDADASIGERAIDDDWKVYLGDEEEGEDCDDEDFLFDDEEDGEEEGEHDVANPLFEAIEEEGGAGDPLAVGDLLDPEEFEEGTEEEDLDSDEEIDGHEAPYYDNDEVFGDTDMETSAHPKETASLSEDRILLPLFKFGSSSIETLQASGIVTTGDTWFTKYHLDEHGDIDQSSLKPVPIAPSALSALDASNKVLIQRAIAMEEGTEGQSLRKDVFFVSPADYETVRPGNVTVAASANACRQFIHAPFDFSAGCAPCTSKEVRSDTNGVRKRQRQQPSETVSKAAWPEDLVATQPPYLHDALWSKWVAFRQAACKPIFTVEERGLFDILQGYPDVMDCLRCWQNAESRREVFLLHLLNHWFKARSVVLAHDEMIQRYRQRQGAARPKPQRSKKRKDDRMKAELVEDSGSIPAGVLENEDWELRDRGFGKTRLFVMLPMRNIAHQYVHTLVSILAADPAGCPKLSVFDKDFTEVEEAMDPTFKRRPRDYRRQFGGNVDDSFCVGVRLEPSRVHVYAHPMNSDLIICSPLGLRRRLQKNGDALVSLSSIEICLVDEAHVLLEQNWQHVAAVMELLNKRPTDTTYGLSDLRRVYAWALDGKSGRHRQTIVSSDISHAAMLGSFRATVNNSGKVLLQRREESGVLGNVLMPVRQHFIRFHPASLETVDDERFAFFTEQVYATKINPLVERDVRTIIIVPSYFDFVRLRNFMHREYRETFVAISEYTSLKQQRRALGQFSDLERPLLLLTERFYFFKRYFVKLTEAIVFYSPPLFPGFYSSLVNRLVPNSPNALALTVYGRYDSHELNRIVGTQRMRQMLEREADVYSFVAS